MNDTERCANCRTTVGLAARSARGFWDENGRHLGSLCPNCVFYPERVSPAVAARLGMQTH